jgi:hypothetical protein
MIERKEAILHSSWLQAKPVDLRLKQRDFLHLAALDPATLLQDLQGLLRPRDARWARNLGGGAETLPAVASGVTRAVAEVGRAVLPQLCEEWGVAAGELSLGEIVAVRYTQGFCFGVFHWDVRRSQYGNMLIGVRCDGVVGGTTFFGNGRFKLQLQEGEVACWRNYDGEGRLLKDACHGVGVVTEGVRVVLTVRIYRKGFNRAAGVVEEEVGALLALGKRKHGD